ncbi:Cysteine desulfuration protein SufE [Hartmannibacter diazotrophicus]|uniref:Cysteine desulfuration protein SufE n=1 Tax=Hartmannibacter diazotrophicus TaxID=1482074 RepID=A0A2C9D5S4_9HYPH|nr:SufE family protein [Hartmannibacter diazotrophicus]SON54865.1 Cysteine desulfuration protein SufE [Hartmannibacter diazotrophicus]
MTLDEIRDNFAFLDDWEDRYRYIIELGKDLPPLDDALRTPATKVQGCTSQVWLVTREEQDAAGKVRLHFQGDSDAHIVRGLVAVLIATYDGLTPAEIMAIDAEAIFEELGLREHLSSQRSNGLRSMVKRIRADAGAVMA